MKKGKLIVIDGSDGSGKATQTKLLVARLKREKRKVKTLDFPQYEENLFGRLIAEYLRGERGNFLHTDPYIASVLYAADRFESKEKIEKWLKEGNAVILDRYVSASQIHQGGKIRDTRERTKFLTWLDNMEFGVFKLPRPNAVIYLSVPVPVSKKLLTNKNQAQKKKYTKGKKDIVENNNAYLEAARKSAETIVKKKNNWKKIQCISSNKLRSREAIHEDVYSEVKKYV